MTGMDKRCLKHDLDITVDTWKYLFYFKLSQNIFVPWVYVKIKQCGPVFCSILLILTSVRKMVTNNAIRPGTISTGIRNPMNETTVRRVVGR